MIDIPALEPASFDSLARAGADALVLVGPAPFAVPQLPAALGRAVEQYLAADAGGVGRGQAALLACAEAPGRRLVLAATGALAHFTDDVRRYAEAAVAGVQRAAAAGARRPAVALVPPPAAARDQAGRGRFAEAPLVAALGALHAGWRNPQVRELRPENGPDAVLLVGVDATTVRTASALERGRTLARDLTAGDPEHMAPEPFAAHCERVFASGPVQVEVERDAARICRDNPLLGAVARASMVVERHRPRIVTLRYDGGVASDGGAAGEGRGGRHLFFAGKGVTYDTGGADLKVGGHMAGMCRDKGGAAGIAGFFAALAELRPKGLRATACLGLVRNSIGADAFVADEVLVSRAGVPLRVGNTDAEGRMVLADMLAALLPHAREAVSAASTDVVLLSVATLTGHVGRAYGPYVGVLGNGPAIARDLPAQLRAAGEALGEPAEISTVRREDYDFVAPKGRSGLLLQANNAASVNTPRGHQFPFAFLEQASGIAADQPPLPYVHLDIAAAADYGPGPFEDEPTGVPVLMLSQTFAR